MALPAPFPGRLLEPGGDVWPRGMTVTPQGAQDPAYRPTPLFLRSSMNAAAFKRTARLDRRVIKTRTAVRGLSFQHSRSG